MNLHETKDGDKAATSPDGQTVTFCHHTRGGWCFPVALKGVAHMTTRSDDVLLFWAAWLFERGLGRGGV